MKNKRKVWGSILVCTGFLMAIFYYSPFVEIIKVHAESSHETILDEHKKEGEHDDHDRHGKQALKKDLDEHGEPNKHQGHDEHEGKEKIIKMTQSQMREFGIELAVAGAGNLHTFIDLPGEIVLNPDRLAHIVPRIPGIVTEVFKTIGDSVRKGEKIAVLESKEIGQAKTDYFTARSEVNVATVQRDVMNTQVDVAKTALNIAAAKQNIAETNLIWQKEIEENTKLLLKLLKENKAMDTIIETLSGKSIGKNRTKLLTAYAAFNYAKTAYERESGLRKKKISSESDYLNARKEYGSTKSEFQALFEEVVFTNRVDLKEKEQEFQMEKQAVKAARQAIKVADQDKKAKEVSLSVALSNLNSAIRKMKIYGLTKKEIAKLQAGGQDSSHFARYIMRSPFNGTVIEKHITLGEMVKEDSETFVIADLASVWANLNVYQKDIPYIRKGQTVFIVSGQSSLNVQSKISWVSPLVGKETRTAVVRVVLPNEKGDLLPGLFINGKVAIAEGKAAQVVIPKTAIQTIEGKTSVFIKTDKGIEPGPVTIGRENGIELEIISGLNPGQEYVKTGAFTLKAELAKGSFGDGHNH